MSVELLIPWHHSLMHSFTSGLVLSAVVGAVLLVALLLLAPSGAVTATLQRCRERLGG